MQRSILISRSILRGNQGTATLEYGLIALAVMVAGTASISVVANSYASVFSEVGSLIVSAADIIKGGE